MDKFEEKIEVLDETEYFQYIKVYGIGMNNTPYIMDTVRTKRHTIMDDLVIAIKVMHDHSLFEGKLVVEKPTDVYVSYGLPGRNVSITQFTNALKTASEYAEKIANKLQVPFTNK